MIRKIFNCIKNIVKIGTLISVDDSGNVQSAIIAALGKKQKTAIVSPYGLESNPPLNSLVVTWTQNGNEESLISMASDPKNRTKNLVVGEVKVSNHETGACLYLKADGKIYFKGPVVFEDEVTAASITTETLEATTDITTPAITDGVVELFVHKHADPQGGFVGPPVAGP